MREVLILILVAPFVFLVVLDQRLQDFQIAPIATPQAQATVITVAVPTPGPIIGPPSNIVEIARRWIGTPYLWGGCTPRGVDCSCFVQNVLSVVGIQAPRTTVTQVAWATPVAWSDMRVGDLIFFDNTCRDCGPNPTHVGMYIGGGLMIHAGDPVHIESVDTARWRALFHSAGRPRGL